MNVIVLGGKNPQQYEWVREVREALEFAGLPVVLHDYAHWLRGEREIDFEAELDAVAELATVQDDGYIVVAKSIGCVLGVISIARGALKPSACLLLGLPLKTAKTNAELVSALASLPTTIFAQNEQDPLGSYEDVKAFARPLVPATTAFVPLPGDSHDYADFELITTLATKLVKSL